MATTTKTKASNKVTTLTQAQIVKRFSFAENATMSELKAYKAYITTMIQDHTDYVAPSPKPHLKKRKESVKTILYQTYGLNGAFNAAKKLIKGYTDKDGNEIKHDPANWVADGTELNQKALDFATKSLAKTKVFMTAKMAKQSKFTPNDIITTWARAYSTTEQAFIKKQNLYLKPSK